MRNIEEALQEHKQAVLDAGFSEECVLGVFLYGSQNYDLATENSDVDTKAIIIPTLKELLTNKRAFVKELSLPNGEKCVVMDICHLIENFKKQNINYIEILFTKYDWINPLYKEDWAKFLKIKRDIAYYDQNRAILSMSHQAIHTLSQEKTNKKIAQAMHLRDFIKQYMQLYPYNYCMTPLKYNEQKIKNIKAGIEDCPEDEIEKLKDFFNHIIFMEKLPVNEEKQEMINNAMLLYATDTVRKFDIINERFFE